MPTAQELQERIDFLRLNRAQGTLTVRFCDGATVIYKSDAEMAAAEAAVVRQLAELAGTTVHTVAVYSTKGLEA